MSRNKLKKSVHINKTSRLRKSEKKIVEKTRKKNPKKKKSVTMI